ncbi:DUF3592 domain-containing protein [Sphingosinicella terrae]|uniref:DUF3592 domain-containing protein n=1 Tax=Sphingosinicella terrae TaxID=2172047 RepID=UPI000E0DBE5D|nr:DUF3592 domain-containing protein [Sphingosinicella terrae]
MRRRHFRLGTRGIILSGAAFAIAVALLILWLGARYDRETEQVIAEGRLAEGRFLYREYGSCSGQRSCESDTIHIAYDVGGVTYRTSMSATRSGREPVFEDEVIRVPRLGPERLFQVVYLPGDPAISRVREDLKTNPAAVYGTAGMFGFIGLVFGAFGLFVLRRRRGLGG